MFKALKNRLKQRFETKECVTDFPAVERRTAILVVHGMGAQKPYATLDQFGRGLIGLFGQTKVQRNILFRHHKANPINKQADWTQAFLRLTPAGTTSAERVVDVFEYYWAPVITDLVTPTQSLRFLIFSALTPFQYLRDNLILINEVTRECRQKANFRGRLKIYLSAIVEALQILFREFARMLFIFIPLIGVFSALYWLVAQKLLNFFEPNEKSGLGIVFCHWPLHWWEFLSLGLMVLRVLFLAMSSLFLFQEFFKGHDRENEADSPWPYRVIMIVIFAALAGGPLLYKLYIEPIIALPHFKEYLALFGMAVLLMLLIFSKIVHDAIRRAARALIRHLSLSLIIVVVASLALCAHKICPNQLASVWRWIFVSVIAPLKFVDWPKVGKYAVLAALLYVVNGFLTTAIGGLAVYLGADDLSKNYAARCQILHECSATLLDLLRGHKDLTDSGIAGDQYDRVLIAAHSLGTVICYDMLNQLIVRKEAKDPAVLSADLTKIKGMLTFGSPLNKVIYFFRARLSKSTTLLERILFVLHPFRLQVPMSDEANAPVQLPFPFPPYPPFAADFKWRNAYSPFDLISGKMFFYDADCNARIERGVTPWTAHVSYWENPDLYRYFAPFL